MYREKTFTPYISMVVSGRNDLHCGNFVERLNNTLRMLDYHSKIYKFDLEYVIVEWNPHSGDKLVDVLYKPSSANLKVRVITVSNELHLQVPTTEFDAPKADEMTFFQGIAQNVGIRRANGEFVLVTNGDIILNHLMWECIKNIELKDDHFYRTPRFDSTNVIPTSLHVSEIVSFLDKTSTMRGKIKPGMLYTKAAGDFILAHKSTFNEVMGFPEMRCDGLKIDGDILQSMIINKNQCIIGTPAKIYHQFHENRYESAYNLADHVRLRPKSKVAIKVIDSYSSLKTISTVISRNNNNWGLKGIQLPEDIL